MAELSSSRVTSSLSSSAVCCPVLLGGPDHVDGPPRPLPLAHGVVPGHGLGHELHVHQRLRVHRRQLRLLVVLVLVIVLLILILLILIFILILRLTEL